MLNRNDQVALATYLKDVARFLEHAHQTADESDGTSLDEVLQSKVSATLVEALPQICQAINLSEEEMDLLAKVTKLADYLALGLNAPWDSRYVKTGGVQALFESIRLSDDSNGISNGQALQWHYPLKPLSPESIFPTKGMETNSYQNLWDAFVKDAKKLPTDNAGHLLLDGFDTLWQNIAHAVPMFGRQDVSLYDHSKIMAALSVALFAWHKEHPELSIEESFEEDKFLIIQGDFFGIQNFIFATGSQSNKSAAKLLRGRSFQVSLFSELAALTVLKACELPATSQILNAAGKFMIIAPNSEKVRAAAEQVKATINQWFLKNGSGQVSLGLSVQTAKTADFESQHFESLIKRSFEALETEKYRRFNLVTAETEIVLPADYKNGVCQYNQSFPADKNGISNFSQDQIDLGKWLVKKDLLLITPEDQSLNSPDIGTRLKTVIFGWQIWVCENNDLSSLNQKSWANSVIRCWDFSLPKLQQAIPWHGYARRAINAFVPRFTSQDDQKLKIEQYYLNVEENEEDNAYGSLKTFAHLACENRQPREENQAQYIGKVAIATLKGDVDNLGTIFQKGLANPSLTKMTALSRYMTQFFSVWLPAFCAEKYPNIYTVFAGGDDFFMIGPWRDTQKLAFDMRNKFTEYVAENPEITFSAGISLTSADVPLPRLSAFAEEALEQAKKFTHKDAAKPSKNAVTIYGQSISWDRYRSLEEISYEISALKREYGMSTSYLYGLISVIDLMLDKHNIESGMWLSRFRYRTRRFANELKDSKGKNLINEDKDRAYRHLEQFFATNIGQYQGAFKIPLFNHFYALRQR